MRRSFFSSLLVLGVGITSSLSIPLILKKIVDSFSTESSVFVMLILLAYGLIWVISQASDHIRGLLTFKMEQRITFVLGRSVLSHLYRLSHSYFINKKPGALMNIIRRAQQDVPNIILGLFFHVIPTVFEFLIVIIIIYNLYPLIYSFILMGTLVSFFLYTFLSIRRSLNLREKANEIDRNVDGVVADWLANYEAIKIFGRSDLALQTCENELKKRENAEVTFFTKYTGSHLGQALILGIGLSTLTYMTGIDVVKGKLTIGDFILFNGYILQFITPVGILGQVTQEIKKAILDMEKVINLLITKSDIIEPSDPLILSSLRFNIIFDNVSFRYDDRDIIKCISFKVEEGETAMLVGPSGIGKSTLAKLLLRLYDPTEGRILINNINIKQVSLKSLYETVGWVPQETYLLNDTIYNNIIFSSPEATLFDCEEALDKAQLLDSIRKLPQGLNTIVGDRGVKLSGGEKQRLSLARLFLKKPKICIFDECTSFLDEKTALIIQNNIMKFLPHMTKLVIAHTPFLIGQINQVINMEELMSERATRKDPHLHF